MPPPSLTERYRRAEYYALASAGKRKPALNTTVYPNWIGQSDCFWYLRELDQGSEYRLVNAATQSNTPAFDHKALATALAQASQQTVDPNKLNLEALSIELEPLTLGFNAFEQLWHFDAATQHCEPQDSHPALWVLSPDASKAVFVRDCNLWLKDLHSQQEKPLTTDGERHFIYASTPTAYGRQEVITCEAIWSPDSRRIFTQVKDTRQVRQGMPLVRNVPPAKVGVIPDILDPDRRMALPGDEHIEGYYFLSIDVDSGQRIDADYPLAPVFSPPYVGFFSGGRGWWAPDNRRAYFIDLLRDGKTGRLLAFDTDTGEVEVVIGCFRPYEHRSDPANHVLRAVRAAAAYKLPIDDLVDLLHQLESVLLRLSQRAVSDHSDDVLRVGLCPPR